MQTCSTGNSGWAERRTNRSARNNHLWRWYWNLGGGAMTDLFTHWIDVVHWAMKAEQPRDVHMLGDKYIFEQWECPDTVQALLRYSGFDAVYEGMMSSSIDDGGLEFRGTDVHRESAPPGRTRF
jgi:predicted dehydrogenase